MNEKEDKNMSARETNIKQVAAPDKKVMESANKIMKTYEKTFEKLSKN